MDYGKEALKYHKCWQGKLETACKMPIETRDDLSIAYTPGVAAPCLEIQAHPEKVRDYTGKGNTIAVVSDGSAVLGLGNIGPEAGLPVMEGKCVLFKALAGINAVPLVLASQDVEDIVRTVRMIAPGFGGINLEDIAAPRCFEIESRLQDLGIPVFHDDQHGTAIVVLAALKNALQVVEKADPVIVINGMGSAGCAICTLLLESGFDRIIPVDRNGILTPDQDLTDKQRELLARCRKQTERGSLADAMKGADVFVGVSAPGIVTPDMVSSMGRDAIVFAMANPVPEIDPELAREAGAAIVGTGRSDQDNQINNLLAFPGIFAGALQAGAAVINTPMKLAAANAIAAHVKLPAKTNIIPSALDRTVTAEVADAVARAAQESGVCTHV